MHPEPTAPKRTFIFANAYVQVEADTLEDAQRLLARVWESDMAWAEIVPGVEVFCPDDVPADVIESDDGPRCICPPDLVARGGFKGGCPVHG